MNLVTWNSQWCCGLDGRSSPQRIVDGARALADFDVLCLQEIAAGLRPHCAATPGDQPAQLAGAAAGLPVSSSAPAVDEFDARGSAPALR